MDRSYEETFGLNLHKLFVKLGRFRVVETNGLFYQKGLAHQKV